MRLNSVQIASRAGLSLQVSVVALHSDALVYFLSGNCPASFHELHHNNSCNHGLNNELICSVSGDNRITQSVRCHQMLIFLSVLRCYCCSLTLDRIKN